MLLSISADVEAEEASGFNPSGLGANDIVDITDDASRGEAGGLPNGLESDLRSNDGLTTTTESSLSRGAFSASSKISAPSSKMSARDTPASTCFNLFEGLSTEHEKEARLGEIFTSLKPIDIRLALQKTKGDADAALDSLLNTAFLEQTGERQRGVDGFYAPDDVRQPRKKKGKKKRAAVRVSESTNSSTTDVSNDPEAIKQANRRKFTGQLLRPSPQAACR